MGAFNSKELNQPAVEEETATACQKLNTQLLEGAAFEGAQLAAPVAFAGAREQTLRNSRSVQHPLKYHSSEVVKHCLTTEQERQELLLQQQQDLQPVATAAAAKLEDDETQFRSAVEIKQELKDCNIRESNTQVNTHVKTETADIKLESHTSSWHKLVRNPFTRLCSEAPEADVKPTIKGNLKVKSFVGITDEDACDSTLKLKNTTSNFGTYVAIKQEEGLNANVGDTPAPTIKDVTTQSTPVYNTTAYLNQSAHIKQEPLSADICSENNTSFRSISPAPAEIKAEPSALANSWKLTNCTVRLKKLTPTANNTLEYKLVKLDKLKDEPLKSITNEVESEYTQLKNTASNFGNTTAIKQEVASNLNTNEVDIVPVEEVAVQSIPFHSTIVNTNQSAYIKQEPDICSEDDVSFRSLSPAPAVKAEPSALYSSWKMTNCTVRLKKLTSTAINRKTVKAVGIKNAIQNEKRKRVISSKKQKKHIKYRRTAYRTLGDAENRRILIQNLFGISQPAKKLKRRRAKDKTYKVYNISQRNKAPNEIITRTKRGKLRLRAIRAVACTLDKPQQEIKNQSKTLRPIIEDKTTVMWPMPKHIKYQTQKVAIGWGHTVKYFNNLEYSKLVAKMQPHVLVKRLNLLKLCQLESGAYLVSDTLLEDFNNITSDARSSPSNCEIDIKLEKVKERDYYENSTRAAMSRVINRKIKQEHMEVPTRMYKIPAADMDKQLSIREAYSLSPVVRLKRLKLHTKVNNIVIKQEQNITIAADNIKDLPVEQFTKEIKQEATDVLFDNDMLPVDDSFVKQEEDSGISLDFEASLQQNIDCESDTQLANAPEKNVLLQIAIQRALINAMLMRNGCTPIQFKLYNDVEQLKVVLDYLLAK